mmetsp:Transcript_58096/g.173382  ORF Transcript_58096/g.173382 Transcript_58096/m.173382 type:complete len:124 (+) Transcript_58096:55-426(+)
MPSLHTRTLIRRCKQARSAAFSKEQDDNLLTATTIKPAKAKRPSGASIFEPGASNLKYWSTHHTNSSPITKLETFNFRNCAFIADNQGVINYLAFFFVGGSGVLLGLFPSISLFGRDAAQFDF